MSLTLRKFNEKLDDASALERINADSFPPGEKMEINRLLHLARKDCFTLLAAYANDKPAGFALLAVYGGSVYIFLLAVDKNMRSKGYGSEILNKLRELYPEKQIVLDLEGIEKNAPNLEQRITRKRFYQRNGYFETDYFMDYLGVRFEVLCSQKAFDSEDFTELLNKINGEGFNLSIFKGNT